MTTTSKFGGAELAMALGLGAATISLGFNAMHGFAVAGAGWAAVCVLSDVVRMSLPIIAVERGLTGWLKKLVIFCGMFSALNIVNYLADQYGEQIWKAIQSSETVAAKSEDLTAKTQRIAELRKQISDTAEKGSSKRLMEMASDEAKRLGRDGKTAGCGANCLALKERADKAEAREKLEAKLAALETEGSAISTAIEANKVEAKGLAIGLVMLGLPHAAAMAIKDAIPFLIGFLILDSVVYILIPATRWRAERIKAEQEAQAEAQKQADVIRMAQEVASAPQKTVKTKTGIRRRVKKDEAWKALSALLITLPEYTVITSERQLAKTLGDRIGAELPKSTLNTWLKAWVAEGKLDLAEKSKHKKTINLKAA